MCVATIYHFSSPGTECSESNINNEIWQKDSSNNYLHPTSYSRSQVYKKPAIIFIYCHEVGEQMLLHSSPTWTPIYLFLTFYKSTIFYLHYIHNITLMLCFILNADHCQINLFWSSRANICCCAAVLSMFP